MAFKTKTSFRECWYLFKLAIKGSETDFTTGSVNRAIFLLAIPMVLEMVMESLFAVVDVFFVGKIGVEAVAAVGLTESVLTIIYSVAIGFSMGATAMVARRIGENKKRAAADAAVQSLIIVTVLSILVSVAGVVYAEDMLRLMGATDSLVAAGKDYTRIMFGGNITIMLLFLINAIFRGAGNASIAMRSLWLANGFNIVLDPILIFGWWIFPEMGIAGAAWATTIGRGIGVVYQLFILINGKAIIKLSVANAKVKWKIISRLVKISLGGMGQFLIESASWIFLVRIISMFGNEALAGYTIAFRIIVFTILPSWGLSNAAATLVGQNLGARLPERAEQSVWKSANYNMVFLGLVSVVFFILAPPIIQIFSQDELVIQHGVRCLRYVCLGYVFFAYGMVISQSFNGAGDTRTPTYINLFCSWLFQIPFAYALAVWLNLGPDGVYIAMVVALAASALIHIKIFRKGKWKTVSV